MTNNEKIKQIAKDRRISRWKIAHLLNVHENTLNIWLRLPLSTEKEMKILKAIDQLSEGR